MEKVSTGEICRESVSGGGAQEKSDLGRGCGCDAVKTRRKGDSASDLPS